MTDHDTAIFGDFVTVSAGMMVRPVGVKDRLTRNTPQRWLSKLGLSATAHDADHLADADLATPHAVSVFTKDKTEFWIGMGVFDVFNALCATDDFAKLGTGAVVVSDETTGFFGVQEFFKGSAGWGGQVIMEPPRTWTRPNAGATSPHHRAVTFGTLAKNIGADPALIQRCVTGMNGKGRYGIAWHGDKQTWVLARIGAEGAGQFQELDPQTYSKTGLPFNAAVHPAGWPSYWKQEHLFAASQDHFLRSWGGPAISEMLAGHPLLQGNHQRVTLHTTP
ncbi:MAG: hypothetical protein AAF386_00485 [Pseudomonadota bacterium]